MQSPPPGSGNQPQPYRRPPTPRRPGGYDEQPTVMVPPVPKAPNTPPKAPAPGLPTVRPRTASQPAGQASVHHGPPPPKPKLTIRQLLMGNRSIVFICIMLIRMIVLVVQDFMHGTDMRFAAAGAGIYLMALMIASPARRFRSTCVGIMCGLIWSYALVDPDALGTPALKAWPAVFPIGVLAVLIEIIFTDIIRAHRGRFGGHAGTLAAGLPRPAIALQAFAVLLFAIPIAIMCVEGTLAYGFNSEPLTDLVLVTISLPPLIGMFIYIGFVLRRLRGLAPKRARA